jgi:hypothetical protein
MQEIGVDILDGSRLVTFGAHYESISVWRLQRVHAIGILIAAIFTI